ncbi:MAG: methyl-accepting chemotaxis protein [Thermotogae bacterium]|jgi:methyl-accepting chemotaxis protein|nr:methyl-accepting chemotaxis protein [Thermotogota bacterium]
MKVGSKIALLTIIMIIALGVTAIFVYVESFELQNSLPKINNSIDEVQNAYDSTIQIVNLKSAISNAFSTLEFGLSNDSTSILKNQNNLFDKSISGALSMTDQISASNDASGISYDLKKLKDAGDLVFLQSATLIDYQNQYKVFQSNLSDVQSEYAQIESQISALMVSDKTLVATIETNFTTIAASANDLYSLPATKSQIIEAKLNSQISRLPLSQLNIADTQSLLDNLAILVGTDQGQNMVSSMELALKNIYLASSQNAADNQLLLMKTYIQSFKTEMNMGALNPAGVFYANLLLDRYYSLASQLTDLVMKDRGILSEVQSVSATVDIYSQKISNQRDLVIDSLTGDVQRYFNSLNIRLSSLFDKANSNTQTALNNLQISSDPVSNAFNYLTTITLIITVVAGVCVIVFGIFLIFDFKKNLKDLENIVNKIKTGDLSVKIEETGKKDEFGSLQKSFHEMIDYLKEMLVNIKRSTSDLKDGLQKVDFMEDKSAAGIKAAITDIDKSKNLASTLSEALREITERFSKVGESERSTIDKIDDLHRSPDDLEKLSKIQKEIENLVLELSAAKDETVNKSKYLEELKASYASIFNLTERFESMTRQAKILALNVAIKSAKSGSDEYAFLESEMKEFADEFSRISEEIKVETKQFQEKIEKALETESDVASIGRLFDSGQKIIDMVKNVNLTFEQRTKDVGEISEVLKSNDSRRSQINQDFEEKIKLLEEAISLLDSISRSLDESKNVMTDISDLTKKIELASETLDEDIKKFKTE